MIVHGQSAVAAVRGGAPVQADDGTPFHEEYFPYVGVLTLCRSTDPLIGSEESTPLGNADV